MPARRQPTSDGGKDEAHGEGVHRGRSPQAVGHDRGGRRHGRGAGDRAVRHGQGRVRGDAQARRGATGSGCGRSRAATAPAARWRSGCWPTASTSSTCRRSSRPGRGCSTPGTTARPTPMTRTRSRWSRSAPRSLRVLVLRRGARGAADAGRPPRRAVQGEGAGSQPAAPAAVRTGSGTVQEGHHRAAGQGDPRRGAPPGPGRQDPQAARARAARRDGRDREEDQGLQQRAQGPGPRPRLAP